MAYYLLKAWRFWYMLRVIGIQQPLWPVVTIYLSAQPITLLPAGELYRMKALERRRGVPMKSSLPTFTAQGLFEGLGMAVVGFAAALTLHIGRAPALILIALVVVGIIGVRMGYLEPFVRQFNRLPFINLSKQRIRTFSNQNQALFDGRAFSALTAMSLAIELVGVGIALTSVESLGGDLNFFQAALVYIIPVIVGFISFLPGGFGASEQVSIATLIVMDQPNALAVAATILMRAFIVGTGLVYSAVAWTVLRLNPSLTDTSTRAGVE